MGIFFAPRVSAPLIGEMPLSSPDDVTASNVELFRLPHHSKLYFMIFLSHFFQNFYDFTLVKNFPIYLRA